MSPHLSNFIRYLFVGGAATVVDWTVFAIFAVWLELNYLLVGGLGFLLAAGVNYWLCVRFIYSSGARFPRREEILAVYAASGIGLILHALILLVAFEYLELPKMVCKVLATFLVLFWNFGIRNFYVFAEHRSG